MGQDTALKHSGTEPPRPSEASSRRRFLGQAAAVGATAIGLLSLTPSSAQATSVTVPQEALPSDGPWVLARSERVRQLLANAKAVALTDPRRPAVDRFLASEAAQLIERSYGPMMTVHFDVYDFMHRLA